MSYDKQTYIETLNDAVQKLRMSKSAVVISHGGASLMLGLRDETSDIDVQLAPGTFEALRSSQEVKTFGARGWSPAVDGFTFENVDFFKLPHGSILYPFEYKDRVSGYDVTSRMQLLCDRVKLGRTKDLDDILRLKSMWIYLPCHYKDRLSELLDRAGVIDVKS